MLAEAMEAESFPGRSEGVWAPVASSGTAPVAPPGSGSEQGGENKPLFPVDDDCHDLQSRFAAGGIHFAGA